MMNEPWTNAQWTWSMTVYDVMDRTNDYYALAVKQNIWKIYWNHFAMNDIQRYHGFGYRVTVDAAASVVVVDAVFISTSLFAVAVVLCSWVCVFFFSFSFVTSEAERERRWAWACGIWWEVTTAARAMCEINCITSELHRHITTGDQNWRPRSCHHHCNSIVIFWHSSGTRFHRKKNKFVNRRGRVYSIKFDSTLTDGNWYVMLTDECTYVQWHDAFE